MHRAEAATAAADAPRARGDRRVVRLGRDAVRPAPLPVRERGALRARATRPTSSARRRTRRAAGSTRCSPSRRCSAEPRAVPQRRLPRPDPRRAGAEDVEVARATRSSRGRCSTRYGADAFRWYFFTSKQPWDGYRFSVETIGEGVRLFLKQLWSTYYFYALYAHASRGELRGHAGGGRADRRPRPLGAVAHGGDGRAGGRAPRRLRRDQRRARDRRARGRAVQLVRAPLAAALLGRRRGGVRDAAHMPADGRQAAGAVLPVHRRRDLRQPRRHAGRACTCATSRRRREIGAARRGSWSRRWRSRARRCGSGWARAARRRSRCASRSARRSWSPPGASARRSKRLADVVREELNVKRVRFVAAADELGSYEVKANYRTLGPAVRQGRCRWRPTAIAALDPARVAPQALRDGGAAIGIAVGGREHTLGADDLILTMRAARGLQRRARGRPRGGAGPGDRRGAARGGLRARDRPRRAERAQGRRPGGRGPHRAGAGRRPRAARRRHAPTRDYLAGETLAAELRDRRTTTAAAPADDGLQRDGVRSTAWR